MSDTKLMNNTGLDSSPINAVVIGGTHGMGMAIAEALLERKAHVVVTGRNPANVGAAQRQLGSRAKVLQSDASKLPAIRELRDELQRTIGRIHALFINVGVSELETFDKVTEESFDRQFNVNTKGAFFNAQQLAPLVVDGGAIVFTTVTSATGTPTMSVYLGSKAAVRVFAQVLGAELLPRRIRVNAVGPGFIDTPTMGVAGFSAEERAAMMNVGDQVTPMKRHGTVQEVAKAAMFLAFDATFTTGVEIPVDGGLSSVDNPK